MTCLPFALATFLVPALAFLAAGQSAPKRFDVTEAGAIGDNQTINTAAIQGLIDKIAASGGGTIVIPAGVFRTGALFFKQGVNLLVEKGGVLKGSVNPQDYPQVRTRWEGIERDWTSALLNFRNVDRAELSGDGTVDGAGDEWLARSGRGGRRGAGQPAAAPPGPPPGPRLGRPRLVGVENSKHVLIANLRFHNQAVWCLHILYSEDVTLDGLNITADHNIPSSDGIDIDSSRRVRVNNVDIDVNDDCISIKSGKDEDGLRVNRPAEDIVIEHSRFHYGHGGVAMGSETSGGIRNVEVRDCDSDEGNWAPIRFKTQPSRGGVVENITYQNMRLNNTKQAFEFNLEWRMVPPIAPPAKVLPIVRNVTIRNVSGVVASVGVMHGLAGSPILGVKFENCDITAQKGFILEHVRGASLGGLAIHVKEGEPITKTDVQ